MFRENRSSFLIRTRNKLFGFSASTTNARPLRAVKAELATKSEKAVERQAGKVRRL
jgi:hypothetical protein